MCTSKMIRYLARPAKIASSLDWKKLNGSVLTVDIGRDRIGLAVATHPSFGESIKELDPINMKYEKKAHNHRTLSPEVTDEVQNIVKEHNVCGLVVTWPVQKEGRCGAPCGRVLHALDSIVAQSSSVLTNSRLFCLWDCEHVTLQEDEWGRNPIYGLPSAKSLHHASLEQYDKASSSSTAADTWNDFYKAHWPELHKKEEMEMDYMQNDAGCEIDFHDEELEIDESDSADMKVAAAL